MTLRRILVAILSLMLGVGFPLPVHASVLTISGTVTTPSGVPIEGVSVSDGTPPNALTNDDGFYSLQQMQFGTYTLRVTKAGITSESANVTLSPSNPSATRNFTVAYLSSLDLPDPYVSTAGHVESLYATLRTHAPNPGTESCAKIADSRTGNTVDMTHIGTEAGQEVWRYTPSLPENSAEGSFTLDARVDDCATGTRVDTGAQQRVYAIDNSLPELAAYAPQDLGNCLFPCPSVGLIVGDRSSGIVASSARLSLSHGGVPLFSDAPMSSTYSSGIYRGFGYALPALVAGETYTAEFEVSDRAGNVLSFSYSFEVITFDVSPSHVQLPAIAGSLTHFEDFSVGTFPDVRIEMDAFVVDASGSAHSGSAIVEQTIPLAAAQISYTVNGVPFSVLARSLASPQTDPFSDRITYHTTHWIEGLEDVEHIVAPSEWLLGTLKVILPEGAEGVFLSMPESATTAGIGDILPMGPCDPDYPCDPPPGVPPPGSLPALPKVEPFLIFGSVNSADAIATASADEIAYIAQRAAAFGAAPTGTPQFVHKIARCDSDDAGASLKECTEVTGTQVVPDIQGQCRRTACVGEQQMQSFLPTDFASKCGVELPCSSPESPIRPSYQSAAGPEEEQKCKLEQTGFSRCTGDQWLKLTAHHWIAKDQIGTNNQPLWKCEGNADSNGRRDCEYVELVIMEGGPGYNNGDSWGRARDGLDGAFREPSDSNPFTYRNFRYGWVKERILDRYTYSGGGCDAQAHVPGTVETANGYDHTREWANPTGEAMSFVFDENYRKYPSSYFPYGCWTRRFSAWVGISAVLQRPNYGDPLWRHARMTFWQAWQVCAWGFTGVSVSWPLTVTADIDEQCDSRKYLWRMSTMYSW